MINEIATIKLLSPEKDVRVTSTKEIREIVFHPSEPVMFVKFKDGNWRKCKYEVTK